jgi:hypothetical protein
MKILVSADRGKNRLHVDPAKLSWQVIRDWYEATDMGGSTQPGDLFLLEEFDLDALPDDLRTFLKALDMLCLERRDRETMLVQLLREVFTAGLKTGMKHAEEIRARQLML